MKTFNNKIVVITGAGSGIGRALALECGKRGARLALNDYAIAGLEETIALLHSQGVKEVHHKVFDVSDEEAMFSFAEGIKQQLGNAHVIINNAGIAGSAEPAYNTPTSTYRRVMEINFFGVLYGTKAFLPQLVENNEGAVVNISSIFGLFGPPSNSDYSASKFAVRGFTEALSVEFHKSPISIHCVHPGGIDTNIAASAISEKDMDNFDTSLLSTPPEDLARRVVKGILKKQHRIIYGNMSGPASIAGRFFPKWLQDRVIWWQLSRAIDLEPYRTFLKDKWLR